MKDKLIVPKIIHYCWFGKKKKSGLVNRCILTWKRVLPDFEIMEWNEENFDINSSAYTKQAYVEKKYAFVSDVARLYALYNYGGIYLDTDVNILKRFDELLKYDFVTAFESEKLLMSAAIIVKKHSEIIGDLLKEYNDRRFLNDNGNSEMIPNTNFITQYMLLKGLRLNKQRQTLNGKILILPIEIWGAFDADNSLYLKCSDTILVHKCAASWGTLSTKPKRLLRRFLAKILGKNNYTRLRYIIKNYTQIQEYKEKIIERTK